VAVGKPLNGMVEVGGPEQFRFDEIIRKALAARQDPRTVVADPGSEYFGAVLDERSLVPGDGAQKGEVTLADYVSRKAAAAPQPAAAAR